MCDACEDNLFVTHAHTKWSLQKKNFSVIKTILTTAHSDLFICEFMYSIVILSDGILNSSGPFYSILLDIPPPLPHTWIYRNSKKYTACFINQIQYFFSLALFGKVCYAYSDVDKTDKIRILSQLAVSSCVRLSLIYHYLETPSSWSQ